MTIITVCFVSVKENYFYRTLPATDSIILLSLLIQQIISASPIFQSDVIVILIVAGKFYWRQ